MATAPTTVPAAGAALPTPPSTTDPTNFDTRGDAFFAALPGLQTSENALAANVYTNADVTYDNAVEVQANADAVAANTALAALYAGAVAWVSGTTYAVGDRRWSPLNGLLYRRLTIGAGATDPSADTTNWTPVAVNSPAQIVSASVVQAVSGQCLALANTTAETVTENGLLWSDRIDNAAWVKGSATPALFGANGPNGVPAYKLSEVAATAIHFLYQTITTAANVVRTLSFYAKAAGRDVVVVELDKDGAGADAVIATFNLATGVASGVANFGTASGATASMLHVGDSWWLCRLSGTCSTSAGTSVRSLIYMNSVSSYLGDTSKGVVFAGLQNEQHTTYTSRIPTTSAAVTRAAGQVGPQRVILPASPAADAWVRTVIANGVYTNVIDPNGQTLEGTAGPMTLDARNSGAVDMQYINGTWRVMK